jgi:hypothetical protein
MRYEIPPTNAFRCTAPGTDLDSGQHGRRSQKHTELLVKMFELGDLWDQYGLVGDVIVSVLLSTCYFWILIIIFSHSLAISPERIFTSFWHLIYYIS